MMADEFESRADNKNPNQEKVARYTPLREFFRLRDELYYYGSVRSRQAILDRILSGGQASVALSSFLSRVVAGDLSTSDLGEVARKEGVELIGGLEELFDNAAHGVSSLFLRDQRHSAAIGSLIRSSAGKLGNQVNLARDLVGLHSLVRRGLVKRLETSEGTVYVAKKQNPDKVGRLQLEIQNVLEVEARLGSRFFLKDFVVEVIVPVAIVYANDTAELIVISPLHRGDTLEETLLTTKNIGDRERFLSHARILLEHLYDRGVIWGDMAPRNILVDKGANCLTYRILDFEKTAFVDGEVSRNDRFAHCRGPMCVEEFGAICSQKEVVETFAPYFDPSTWDFDSIEPLTLPKPKREVMDLIGADSCSNVKTGEYNRVEHEILKARFPIVGQNGLPFFPLHVSFRVDHYLGSKLDQYCTEVLEHAAQVGLLECAVGIFEDLLDEAESQLLVEAVLPAEGAIKKGVSSACAEIRELLEKLYGSMHSEVDFCSILRDFKERRFIEPISHFSAAHLLDIQAIRSDDAKSVLLETLGPLLNKGAAFLFGGCARRELTVQSDIDILRVTGDSFSNSKEHILVCAESGKFNLEVNTICRDQCTVEQVLATPHLANDYLSLSLLSPESPRWLPEFSIAHRNERFILEAIECWKLSLQTVNPGSDQDWYSALKSLLAGVRLLMLEDSLDASVREQLNVLSKAMVGAKEIASSCLLRGIDLILLTELVIQATKIASEAYDVSRASTVRFALEDEIRKKFGGDTRAMLRAELVRVHPNSYRILFAYSKLSSMDFKSILDSAWNERSCLNSWFYEDFFENQMD